MAVPREPAPVTTRTYHVFLASPGDMEEERQAVRHFFESWNRIEGAAFGIRCEVVDWENYAIAGVGRPQELITRQTLERFAKSLALVICLLGHRFGSPTGENESGTEAELNWAVERWGETGWPEILLYFRRQEKIEAAADPETLEQAAEQLKKVRKFQARCKTGTPQVYYKEFAAGDFQQVAVPDVRAWLAHPERPWRRPRRKPRRRPAPRSRPEPYGDVPPGKNFTEKITGVHFLWVKEGRLQIGQGRYRNAVRVRISPFWIGETAVTNRQYRVFTQDSKHPQPDSWQTPRFADPEQPVVDVSWHEAAAFCRWLSQASGLACSLCSEAQWEYAARGSDGRTYPWGNEEPTPKKACHGLNPDLGRPAPAGVYPHGRGPFGTLDQAGNVWEWCLDAWYEDAYDSWREGEPLDPVTEVREEERDLAEDAYRVLRGACWIDPPDLLPAALRYQRRATYRAVRVGFRVAVRAPGNGRTDWSG